MYALQKKEERGDIEKGSRIFKEGERCQFSLFGLSSTIAKNAETPVAIVAITKPIRSRKGEYPIFKLNQSDYRLRLLDFTETSP